VTRGWSSQGLPVVADDEKLWTAAQAAVLLGPPDLSVSEVRRLIRERGLEPAGKRRTTGYGQSGRYARVYRAEELIEAYDRLSKGSQ
jgi:hypothetical protein